jgi:hypothetical protein
MAGVKVTFKVGNRRGVGNKDVFAQESFVEAMEEEAGRSLSSGFQVDVPRLQRVLDTRISASLKQAVTFAAMNMMGVKSQMADNKGVSTKILFNLGEERGLEGEGELPIFNASKSLTKALPFSAELEWQALARATIIKKSGGKIGRAADQARKYFIHTGSLQKEIRALAKDVVARTGTVKVYYAKGETTKSLRVMQNQSRVRVGQLQLRFLPKIPIRTLPGFLKERPDHTDPTVAFERTLGLSKDTLTKLQGVQDHHRPLLQPVFSYWMLTRIPRLVGAAISNSIRTR